MIFDKIIPRLLLGFLLLSPLPLAGLAWLHSQTFQNALETVALTSLSSLADKKADQINAYVNEHRVHSRLLAQLAVTLDALKTLPPLRAREGAASARYLAEERRYRDYFRTLFDSMDYYDLLFIDAAGNVVLSVLHEPDFGSNLNTGPYRDSSLAHAHHDAIALPGTQITVARTYAPSGDKPAIFVVAPASVAGKVVGTVALQLNLDRLTAVTGDATGLGKSGETVLAQRDGGDALYVGPLRHISAAAFRHRVPMKEVARPMQEALAGRHGRGITRDYAGVEMIGAWRYLPALGWGMVVKTDTAEAFAPAYQLRKQTLAALALLLLAAGVTALLFGRTLVKPIRQLTLAARRIAAGDLSRRAPVEGMEETRQLAQSFNLMADHVVEAQATLEQRVEERTRDLQASKAQYEELTARIPVGVYRFLIRTDGSMAFEYVSARFCEILDLAAEAILADASAAFALVHPEDLDEFVRLNREAARILKPFRWEGRFVVQGEVRWLQIESTPTPLANGGSLWNGVMSDTTERRKMEEALRQERDFATGLVNTAPMIVLLLDTQGIIEYANPYFEQITGYRLDEVRGKEWFRSFLPEGGRENARALFQNAAHDMPTRGNTNSIITRGGEKREIEWYSQAMRDSQGEVISVLAAGQDVTARRAMELALNISTERLNEAQHIAQLGSWELDLLKGELIWSDEIFCLFEIDKSQFGATYEAFLNAIHPDDRDEVNQAYVRSLETRTPYEITHRLRMSDGRIKWVHERCATNFDAEGKPLRSVGTVQDVTAQKLNEAALIEARQSAEAASRAKSEFLANMSHEIRTPMNAILGLTQLVLDTELTPRQQDFLNKAHASARTLLGLLNDILDYSKIEAGRMEIERVPFRVQSILENVANLFSARIEEKGLEVFFEIAPEVPVEILGDPQRLTQVLSNLVDNATKFTERGEIHLEAGVLARNPATLQLRFAVRDTGIGLNGEQANRLFQPFVQADGSTTRKYGGTGLGLSICRRLVSLMGGEISASSVEGRGSTFAFTIQAGVTPSPGQSQPPTQAGAISDRIESPHSLQGLRILLVEDNEINRLMTAKLLERRGAVLALAQHGGEALERISHEAFDAVLLDLHMPIMDGFEAARMIRDLPRGKSLPIIAMTAAVSQEDRARCAAIGMQDFIAKPVDPEAMIRVLLKWVRPDGQVPRGVSINGGVPASGTLPEAMPGFDLDLALRRLDGNRGLLAKLLLDFAGTQEGAPDQLDALVQAGESEQAAILLHTLKGAAANLGAVALAEAAWQLEQELGAGGVPASSPSFAASLNATLDAIKTNIAPLQSIAGEPAIDREALAQTLNRLWPYLQEQELIPVELMETLHHLARSNVLDKVLARLIRQVDHFDHDGALASVVQLAAIHGVTLE